MQDMGSLCLRMLVRQSNRKEDQANTLAARTHQRLQQKRKKAQSNDQLWDRSRIKELHISKMENQQIRYFSTFTGVGGFEIGIQEAIPGAICVGMSEIDTHASNVLRYKFKGVKNYGDITKIKPEELPDFDILCGGFPCQSFSIAGKRMGFKDTRGTLFYELARIAKCKQPEILFFENVKGLLSHEEGRTITTILKTLDELGYDAEWQVLNSKHFGVPQNRERIIIVGHLRGKPRLQVFPIPKATGINTGKSKGKE